jgi:dolichol kinase
VVSNELSKIDSSYRIELIRKAIHLCSLSIPIIYFFTPRAVALTIIIPITLWFIAVDIARHYHRPMQDWFYGVFGWLLRPRESDLKKKRLNGATYVFISATLCIFFFPKLIAITSFSILIISDLTAALVGRRFGKHRFLGKTSEGSLAFFVSAIIVVLLTPKIEYQVGEYIIGTVAASFGAIVEALPFDIDDNLSIPLSVGTIMWLQYHFALPLIDLYKLG